MSEEQLTERPAAEAAPAVVFKPAGNQKNITLAISLAMGLGAFVVPLMGCLGALDGHLERQDITFLIAGFPLLVAMLWYAQSSAHAMLSMRLNLDSKGIAWRTSTKTIESDWDNALEITPVPVGKGTVTGLKLGKQARIIRPGEKIVAHGDQESIPLAYFGDPHKGELADTLKRFAPQLYRASGS